MAKRFERHARAKSDWDSEPGRSAALAAVVTGQDPDPARRAPARKNTRDWCKGKTGVAHVPGLAEHVTGPRERPCEWRSRWSGDGIEWNCHHREPCSRCGKVLREPWQIPDEECPSYPGTPEQRAEAEADAVRAAEHRKAFGERWGRRKPAVTGPQGYRRPKATV